MTGRKSRILLILLAVWLGAVCFAQEDPKKPNSLADTVSPVQIYDFCRKMSLPEFSGRLTGHPGYTAAARWAAGRFQEWGLRPLDPPDDYLQPFPAPHTVVDTAGMTLFPPAEKDAPPPAPVKLEAGPDFLPLLYSDSGDRTGDVVFAGWGIHAPELGYDDYAGVDVAGKFVLCFRGTPDPTDDRFTDYDQHRTRMKAAHERGALGIIYIYDEPQANPNGDWIAGFTPAEISEKTADRLLAEKGMNSKTLREDLRKYGRPLSFALKSRIRLQVGSRHFSDSVGYNVVGQVEGADPALKEECVVVGAHFDHCGAHLGFIYPGANDNASGSAAVMELARVLAGQKTKTRRSVVFVLFGGEETGLQGSAMFAGKLPYHFKKITAMINFDMIGEGDGAWGAFGPPAAEELKQIMERADLPSKLLQDIHTIRKVGVRSSDFAPFFLKGIPCVNFASNGPHVFYHQPGDNHYRINPDILADITRLAARVVQELADR